MPWTKEQRKEYMKEYNNSEDGKMRLKIGHWRHLGLVMDTYEDYVTIYYHWLCSTNCEKCNKEYTEKNFKCMYHDHNTGQYRNILCNRCNTNDRVDNTSGIPNVSWCKTNKKWVYAKLIINRKFHKKTFNTKEDAIKYKIEYEKENIYIN